MEIFKTFKPQDEQIARYVEYYYVDIKPNNTHIQLECFPHFYNTISLYCSHRRSENGEIIFDSSASTFQAFTPIHDNVLSVRQTGSVHRVVIVLKPLGVYHFFQNIRFSDYIYNFDFFTQDEVRPIFNLYDDSSGLSEMLDKLLLKRLNNFSHKLLEKTITEIFSKTEEFSVEEFSEVLQVSRQHLNRVFRFYMGVNLKRFHEIVRFRKTVSEKLFSKSGETLTQIASAFNFNDQSHFIKTYQNFTENAPTAFFKKGKLLGSEDTFWHISP